MIVTPTSLVSNWESEIKKWLDARVQAIALCEKDVVVGIDNFLAPCSHYQGAAMEAEVIDADILVPPFLPFKRTQMSEKYPKGHARGRHWKHLKQILQAENYQNYPANEPNYVNIESPPSMYPAKKLCDITGFEARYTDPRTNLRYANIEVFKCIRSLPNEYVQRYLTLRNAAVILK